MFKTHFVILVINTTQSYMPINFVSEPGRGYFKSHFVTSYICHYMYVCLLQITTQFESVARAVELSPSGYEYYLFLTRLLQLILQKVLARTCYIVNTLSLINS